ncbi:MAG TPA: flagellar biosynthetic protein FliR [Pirellulales bacterium]|nr:flagellar biosynthetic protein FliR [Pirellulales bacterium]
MELVGDLTMPWLESISITWVLLFTFVLARIGGLIMTVPVFTGTEVPIQVRGLLAVAMTLVLTPTQWGVRIPAPGGVVDYVILMAGEVLIGMILGLGIVILLSGMQVAGQVIAQMSGMALAEVLAPGSDDQVPLFSGMLNMTATAVFVVIGGHRALIDGLLHSFTTMPIGQGGGSASMAQAALNLLSGSFFLAVRAAAPAMIALLLATLVLGLIGRTLPQLNILVLGFGINCLVVLSTLSVSIGAVAILVSDYFQPALQSLLEAISRH